MLDAPLASTSSGARYFDLITLENLLIRPWQDSNLQSPDPKSGALSIRPHGLTWWPGLFWMTTLTESMVKLLDTDQGLEDSKATPQKVS